MNALTLLLALAAADQSARQTPPTSAEVRQSVEHSLAFLDKSGTSWYSTDRSRWR